MFDKPLNLHEQKLDWDNENGYIEFINFSLMSWKYGRIFTLRLKKRLSNFCFSPTFLLKVTDLEFIKFVVRYLSKYLHTYQLQFFFQPNDFTQLSLKIIHLSKSNRKRKHCLAKGERFQKHNFCTLKQYHGTFWQIKKILFLLGKNTFALWHLLLLQSISYTSWQPKKFREINFETDFSANIKRKYSTKQIRKDQLNYWKLHCHSLL